MIIREDNTNKTYELSEFNDNWLFQSPMYNDNDNKSYAMIWKVWKTIIPWSLAYVTEILRQNFGMVQVLFGKHHPLKNLWIYPGESREAGVAAAKYIIFEQSTLFYSIP